MGRWQRDCSAQSVMTWVFVRRSNALVCNLRHALLGHGFELVTTGTESDTRVELFTDIAEAFERQRALEDSLLREGWQLEQFYPGVNKRSSLPTYSHVIH